MTVAAHGGALVTCDVRAATTYERFDLEIEYVSAR
jgi:hypothetical protein